MRAPATRPERHTILSGMGDVATVVERAFAVATRPALAHAA